MSEEVALAIGDIADWKRRAELAEADAAALRDALWRPSSYTNQQPVCVLCDHETPLHYSHCAAVRHDAGAALLAELEAARAVVDSVTAYFNKRGADHALRAGNEDILTMSEALAEFGIVEQKAPHQ